MVKRWPSGLKISTKIVVTSLIGIALFLAGFLAAFMPRIEDYALSERRYFLKDRTAAALTLLTQYQAEVQAGALSLAEAQARAAKRLRGMVFGKGEYFWIMDDHLPFPRMIMHPVIPAYEGRILDDPDFNRATSMRFGHADPARKLDQENLFSAMVQACRERGSGYVAYQWPKPLSGGGHTGEFYPKESYVALYKPWGWIIGTGEYLDDLKAVVDHLRLAAFVYLGLVTMLAVSAAMGLASSITRPLRRVAGAAKAIAEGDLEARAGVSGAADELDQLSQSFDQMARNLRQREQQRQAAEAARQESEHKMRAVFENAFQLIWLLSPEGLVLECNQSALEAAGIDREDVVGRPFKDSPWWNGSPDKSSLLGAALEKARQGGFVRYETTMADPHHGPRHLDFSIKAARDAQGRVTMLIPEARDITDIKSMRDQLQHMGLHDPLTGLANRTLLKDRVQHALQVARRRPSTVQAVLYLDINRFKIINDSLGHLAGDAILKEVARLLQKRVRETDTVARYGGDDFVILLWELASFREAIWIAKRIQEDLGCTKGPQGERMPIKVSVGLDFLLDQKADPDDVVRNAHLAMSYAKAKGRNFLKVFSPRLLDQVRTSLAMENEMERGIREGEFFLAFQPIVDAGRGRRLAGLEALCRWRHPQRGVIPPGEFIPVAEESGMIVPLGKWVLDTALGEMAAWRAQGRDWAGVFVSVNLSARQLEKPDIVQAARESLGRHGLPPELLHLEITETSLMAGNAAMMEHIVALKGLGVRLAVDDFGTGYSNLSLLTRLDFSDLKVDRSLVMDVESKAENLAVIRAINTMAGSLGATVIVEGVETQAQGDILMGLGCNMQQGYLYSRPAPLAEIKSV